MPDKSAGEFRHGYAADESKPLRPEQYRVYWAVYDFPKEFPEGVRFVVGRSKEAEDWNYIHWSSFGGCANSLRNATVVGPQVSNWTIEFNAGEKEAKGTEGVATFTVQLAGAKTAAGNTDAFNASEPYANLPLYVAVNGMALDPWIIP